MKKTISIILCAVLLVSMLGVMSVSAAPTGTAINSEADFAGMTADGTYYLNSDITVSASYAGEFNGTLDGNGKTVTVNNVPMFETFSGKVSNLTIRGDITGTTDLGALAVKTNGLIAINCKNYANVKVTGANADNTSGFKAGGFVADADEKGQTLAVFRDCANYGSVTVETAVGKDGGTTHIETFVGGFMGRASGFDAKFCENNGAITAPGNRAYAGGFLGRGAWVASALTVLNYFTVVDCVNNGAVTSGYDAGGLAGNIGIGSNDIGVPYIIDFCVNTAEIRGGYRVGGYIGYCYASGKNFTYWIEITNSIQLADVYGGRPISEGEVTFVSPILGYSNSVHNKIQNCIINSEVKAIESPDPTNNPYSAPYFVINGCSSAVTANCEYVNNMMFDNNTVVYYTYATSDSNEAQRIEIATAITEGKVTRVEEAAIKNGTAVNTVNGVVGSNIFSQGASDTSPKIDATLAAARRAEDKVLKGENVQVNYETSETKDWGDTTPEPTNPPKTTDATTTQEPTTAPTPTTPAPITTTEPVVENKGCAGFGVAAIAAVIISAVGCAVVIKKH